MISIVPNAYGEAAGLTLLHFLWQGALLGVLAALSLRMLARSSAQVRYAVACGFLLAMLIGPTVSYVLLLPGTPAAATLGTRWVDLSVQIEPVPFKAVGDTQWFPWVLVAWLIGVAVFSVRAIGGWSLAAYKLSRGRRPAGPAIYSRVRELSSRLGIRHAVRVFESSRVAVPAMFGAIRPVILLPASAVTGLPPSQLEAILAHELAHIARHDFLVNCLQSVVEVLLFYHPGVWWLSRRIRDERELCCDAVAVGICGDRVLYSRALLALEEGRQSFALAATGGDLRSRIEKLLRQPPLDASAVKVNVAIPAFLLSAILISTVSLLAWPDAPAAPPRPSAPTIPVQLAQAAIPAPARVQAKRNMTPYDRWAKQDVVYIMTQEERTRWEGLTSDAEREVFIGQFWLRRDPTPGTFKNELKEEHYRRIVYSNERFASDSPGWSTPRGRTYIVYGPPDEIESHPSGPREIWRYRVGHEFEFTGDKYQLQRDLKTVPTDRP